MAKKPAPSKSSSAAAAGKGTGAAMADGSTGVESGDGGGLGIPVVTSLDQVVGQGRAIATLKQAMASERVHHAWIFSGPSGVGKRTAAIAFALALLADRAPAEATMFGPVEAEPVKVDATHPDLHVVHKALAEFSRDDSTRKSKQTTLSLEVLFEFLIEPAQRARTVQSQSLVHKVFVVDDAEFITPAVQNTLLKLIEEPPLGTVIILITTQENDLLTTIRSRCQRVQFAPVTSDAMQQWLGRIKSPMDAEEKAWLLANFGSSPGQFAEAYSHRMINWRAIVDGPWNDLLSPLVQPSESTIAKFLAASSTLGSTLSKLITDRVDASKGEADEVGKVALQRLWTVRLLTLMADRSRRMLFACTSRGQQASQLAICKIVSELVDAELMLDRNIRYDAVLEYVIMQIAEIVHKSVAGPMSATGTRSR